MHINTFGDKIENFLKAGFVPNSTFEKLFGFEFTIFVHHVNEINVKL